MMTCGPSPSEATSGLLRVVVGAGAPARGSVPSEMRTATAIRCRHTVTATIVVVTALLGAAPAQAVTNTLLVGGDGVWNTPGNWSQGHVPTATEDVVLARSATLTADANGFANSISIPASTGLTLNNAKSLTVGSGSSSIASGVNLFGGAILRLNGPTTWSAGAFGFGGAGVGTLENAGALSVTGAGPLLSHTACCDVGRVHNTSTGTMTRSSGTGDIAMNVPFDNDGSVSVSTGRLDVGQYGGVSGGSFSIAAGSELRTNSSYAMLATAQLTGAGTVNVAAGTLTVPVGATFNPANLTISGGILTLDASSAIAGAFSMTAGSRQGTGTLGLNGTASITGGSFRSSATTTVATAAPATLAGSFGIYDGHTVNLNVQTTWSSGTIGFGGAGVGSLVNNSTLTVSGDVTALHDVCCSAGLIHNAATIIRKTSAGTATFNVPFENAGTLDLQTGTISHPSYAWTQTAGMTNVHAGATLGANPQLLGGVLMGGGTIAGSLTNTSGSVAPGTSPGTLTLTGDYTQASGGTLDVDLSGTLPGTQFDQLLVGGAAMLDGTLALHSGSFTPALTDTFKVISGAASRSGTFSALTGAVAGGVTYSAQYDGQGATVLVNRTPPSNAGAPSIPAAGHPGDVVTCEVGTWTGAPTFTFAWTRDGTLIDGQTAATYTLGAGDVGHDLRCRVVGHNSGGDSAPADSNSCVTSTIVSPPAVIPPETKPPVQAAPVTVAITEVATLPSSKACVSRRLFRIRLRGVAKNKIVSASITLNGTRVRTVRGKALGLPIDLRGLPKGTFTIRIVTTDASGRRLAGKRRYHTCVPRRAG